MKLMTVFCLALFSQWSFAGMNCRGTTIVFHDDGTSESNEVILEKIEGEKNRAVYFGESPVFKFWADHNNTRISLLIQDQNGAVVLDRENIQVARFNVSMGGYWKSYFASLSCSPTRN